MQAICRKNGQKFSKFYHLLLIKRRVKSQMHTRKCSKDLPDLPERGVREFLIAELILQL